MLVAQWVQTQGPYGGSIQCFTVSGTNLIAGTLYFGAYRSADNGSTWSKYLPDLIVGPCDYTVSALAEVDDAQGSIVFAGTHWGLYVSTDDGVTWQPHGLNAGCSSSIPYPISVKSLATVSEGGMDYVFAGTDHGVFRSAARDSVWIQLDSILIDPGGALVVSVVDEGVNYIYAATGEDLYRSTDNGMSWTHSGMGCRATSCAVCDYGGIKELFANFCGDVWRSTDHGETWSNVSNGLGGVVEVRQVGAVPNGSAILAVNDTSVFRSTDNGTTWSAVSTEFARFGVYCFANTSAYLFAGTTTGIFRSADGGLTWTAADSGIVAVWVVTLAANEEGHEVYAAMNYDGLFRSMDNGASWLRVNRGLTTTMVTAIATANSSTGTFVFAGTWCDGLFRSTDNGNWWTRVDSGFAWTCVTAAAAFDTGSGTFELAGTSWDDGVYSSTDYGSHWKFLGSFSGDPHHSEPLLCFALSGTNLIAGTGYGIFLSTDGGATWTEADNPPADEPRPWVLSMVATGSYVFAAGWNGVYRSMDYGASWSSLGYEGQVLTLANNDSGGVDLFACNWDGGVLLSTDYGDSWTAVSRSPSSARSSSLSPGLVKFVPEENGSSRPTNNRIMNRNPGEELNKSARILAPNSLNGGGEGAASLAENGTNLFAGVSDGVWRRPLSEMIPSHTSYMVSVLSGENGHVFPAGLVPVGQGAKQQFLIVPNDGYRVDSVIVDGLKVDSTTSYTFFDVIAPHTIRATFTVNPCTITSGAAGPGTIIPSGVVPVHYGQNMEFTITPDSGNHIDSIIVDGVRHGPVLVYRFSRIVTSHSIVAYFSEGAPVLSLSVDNRWNIVSFPLLSGDYEKNMLFPTARSCAFSFRGSYVCSDSITPGAGYWLKFDYAQTFPMLGEVITADSVKMDEGWNLIGSISYPLQVQDITSNPGGMATSEFFGYNGSYFITDTIQPGRGYWAKVSQPGMLILSSVGAMPAKNRITVVSSGERPPSAPEESAEPGQNIVPTDYSLVQCYPNPFNPSVTIRYDLPTTSRVSVKIFNILGQTVVELVNGIEQSGYKSVRWNASSYSSGVYFYRMEATSIRDPSRSFTQVRKMILVK
ncbi:MAG TPA: T9SS type A sorting domain-containing protein [Bacteroidota bacterium]|nr:T9SS type A sorting domain-containing protein [Bacteroidota bacterium]